MMTAAEDLRSVCVGSFVKAEVFEDLVIVAVTEQEHVHSLLLGLGLGRLLSTCQVQKRASFVAWEPLPFDAPEPGLRGQETLLLFRAGNREDRQQRCRNTQQETHAATPRGHAPQETPFASTNYLPVRKLSPLLRPAITAREPSVNCFPEGTDGAKAISLLSKFPRTALLKVSFRVFYPDPQWGSLPVARTIERKYSYNPYETIHAK